jgi:hypothetical protein
MCVCVTGLRPATALLIVALATSGLSVAAERLAMLGDGPQGMTCHYYVAEAMLPWANVGGDWADAADKAQGGRPYASFQVDARSTRRPLEWDATALVADWVAGKGPVGAVRLQVTASSRRGVVNLLSRENADVEGRPRLTIEWEGGHRDHLSPVADASLSCSTYKGGGQLDIIKIGPDQGGVLVFPVQIQQRRLLRATLSMSASKVYGPGLTIGLFRATLPTSNQAPRAGLADAFVEDEGIESHPDVLFADRFEQGRRAAAWSGGGMKDDRLVASDAAGHFQPLWGRALKVTIPQGSNEGLNSHFRFAANGTAEPDEAFFRYYLRLSENWDPTADGGKLPGLSGTYGRAGWGMRPADGINGWSARGAFFQSSGLAIAGDNRRGIGSYVYVPGLSGPSGAVWGWGLGASGWLQKNRWYSVEQQVKLNQPGKLDGEIRAWVDGELVFERTGLRLRDVADLRVESVWMNVYHGGTAKAPHDLTLYIDNVVIARKYIGPARRR